MANQVNKRHYFIALILVVVILNLTVVSANPIDCTSKNVYYDHNDEGKSRDGQSEIDSMMPLNSGVVNRLQSSNYKRNLQSNLLREFFIQTARRAQHSFSSGIKSNFQTTIKSNYLELQIYRPTLPQLPVSTVVSADDQSASSVNIGRETQLNGRLLAVSVACRKKLIVTTEPNASTSFEETHTKQISLGVKRISSHISSPSRLDNSRSTVASRATRGAQIDYKKDLITSTAQAYGNLTQKRISNNTHGNHNETTNLHGVQLEAIDKSVIKAVESFLDMIGDLCTSGNSSASNCTSDAFNATAVDGTSAALNIVAGIPLKPLQPAIIATILNTRLGRLASDTTENVLEEIAGDDLDERLSTVTKKPGDKSIVMPATSAQFSDPLIVTKYLMPTYEKRRAVGNDTQHVELKGLGSLLVEKQKQKLHKDTVRSVFGSDLGSKLHNLSPSHFSHILSDLNITRHGIAGNLEHWLKAINERKAMRFMHFG